MYGDQSKALFDLCRNLDIQATIVK
jgi:hypothetical protein